MCVSSKQVAERAGITYRQLDYWIRAGLVPGQPEWVGSGRRRVWSSAQVERVCELAEGARRRRDWAA